MATSPTSGPGGGSFDGSAGFATYAGNAVSVADAASAFLTWNFLFAGTELLDRSVPAQPVILATGIYVVALGAAPNSLTDSGAYDLELVFNVGTAAEIELGTITAPMPAGTPWVPIIALTACSYLAAGAIIGVRATNHDGVSARNFALGNTIVQRIS